MVLEWINWSLITSIGTLLTLFLLYFTFKEMIKQRRNSYLPNLFIQNKEVFFQINFKKKLYGDGIFLKEYNSRKKSIVGQEVFWMDLINIGLGPATNIKTTWLFNIYDFIQKNLELDVEEEFSFTLEKNEELRNHKKGVIIENKTGNITYIALEKNEFMEFDFCQTHPVSNQSQRLFLCSGYESLLLGYLYLLSKKIKKKEIEENEGIYDLELLKFTFKITDEFKIPPLFLKVEFKDIEGKKFEKYFLFEFNKKFYPINWILENKNSLVLHSDIKVNEIKDKKLINDYLKKKFDLELV